jgi:tetratricopeptide (TPR) repeat protein
MTKTKIFLLLGATAIAVLFASTLSARRGGGPDDELLRLGLRYADAGKTAEAVEILNDAVDDNPTAERFMALGIVHLQRDEYDLSYANLKEALARDPGLAPARYTLAMLHEKKGMHADALDEWKKFLTVARKKKFREIAEKHIEQLEIRLGIKK